MKTPRRRGFNIVASLEFHVTPSAESNACDVLVIGAGPAGSACAHVLAGAGLDVLLVDQHAFPRDKTCGDGLIPDAQRALSRLTRWWALTVR